MEPTFFDSLLQMILTVGAVLLLFCGTVLIHELGHFLTAKWFGLRIDAFSIGMGPAIWKKTVNGVVYKLSLLPIGGYVALPQMDITGSAFENEDAKKGRLEPVAPWKRIIIALAGPVMNILGAFVLGLIIWGVGIQPREGFQEPVIGWISPESAAYEAGLRKGDLIRMVNEDRTPFWMDVQVAAMLNNTLDLQVVRDGQVEQFYDLSTQAFSIGGRTLRVLGGVAPAMPGNDGIFIRNFPEGSQAFASGLTLGDLIVSVDGEPVLSMAQFRDVVQASEGRTMNIGFIRENEEMSLPVAAKYDQKSERYLIGIEMQQRYEDIHPNPLRQVNYFKGQIMRTLVAFTRKEEVKQAGESVGSVVMIFKGMHSELKESLMNGLWFTALINVNLAIMNLLPLIILDGGHIAVALFEWITGKRPHKGLITGLANAMVILLITLMVFLSFRDVLFLRELDAPKERTEPTPEAPEAPVP